MDGVGAWKYCVILQLLPLRWRHNRRHDVSNNQPHDCLFNHLFRRGSKKISKLRVTGICEGNSPVAGEFPAQMASNAGNISIWWRHHAALSHKKECSLPSARLSIGPCITLVSYYCVLELLDTTYLKPEIHSTVFSHSLFISMLYKLQWLNHIWELHQTFWLNLRPTFCQLGPKNSSQINMCVDAGRFFGLQITSNMKYS